MRKILLCIFLIPFSIIINAKDYTLVSPDKKTEIKVTVGSDIRWSVSYLNEIVLEPSRLALELSDGTILGLNAKVKKAIPSGVNSIIMSAIPVKNRDIAEVYNQLKLEISGNYSLCFRAYNDGVAYRFETTLSGSEIIVKSETSEYSFPVNYQAAWPATKMGGMGMMMRESSEPVPAFGSKNPESGRRGMGPGGPGGNMPGGPGAPGDQGGAPGGNMPGGNMPAGGGAPAMGGMPGRGENPAFSTSYEYTYDDTTIDSIKNTAGLPLYMSTPKGTKIVLTESDLYDYPNMFIKGTGSHLLTAAFPPVVIEEKSSGSPFGGINKTAGYIAKTKGTRTFPWRTLIISPDDRGLLESDMVYKLSSPSVIKTDWIKPGQVTWEWYNGTNVFGVDFVSGINTPTYKYYIDFAAKYGIEYLLIDAGWSGNKDVDIPEIVKYASNKKVGVLLWISWTDMNADAEKVLDQYAAWGVKGVKMDYMNRSDQGMVNFYERIAMETAKRQLLLDFHGAYKPVGLNRKYPNVVNFEGVKGMEANKMNSTDITPSHDVVLLFTRMVAGPMDYTPGAMITAAYGNFKNISSEPMSQGTRAHQAAMYVMYDAPLQMLSDNPSLYMMYDDVTSFLTSIPTVWDKTIGIDGKIGQYAIMARKNGNNWYIGAMTDWSERSFDIDLAFLDGKKYKIKILSDGVNANKKGIDYKITSGEVKQGDKITISMKQGGGWAAVLTPVE